MRSLQHLTALSAGAQWKTQVMGLDGPIVRSGDPVAALLDMSYWDAAWTMWYLACAACADVLHSSNTVAASAADERRQRAEAEEIRCKCLSNMAQARPPVLSNLRSL
jgi:hypothetical protein